MDILKTVILGDKALNLLINHELKLFTSHPFCQNHDKGNVRREHFVEGLIVASLDYFEMVLFGVKVRLCRKNCNGLAVEFVLSFGT
jgi:hypothetical protein